MSTSNIQKWHLRLRISGNDKKINLFHSVLKDMDIDWPWGARAGEMIKVCRVCGGVIYKNPRFDVQHIKAWARQINESQILPGRLKVKIQQYRKEEVCRQRVIEEINKAKEKGEETTELLERYKGKV